MITRQQRIRLRFFLLAGSLLSLGVLAILVWPLFQHAGKPYLVRFHDTSVSGLSRGAAVAYQGVEVGKVEDVSVDGQDLRTVRVAIRVREDFPIRTDMRAKLSFTGITGMKFVEITGGSVQAPLLKRGGEIPMGRGLGERAEGLVLGAEDLLKALNRLAGEENQKHLAGVLEHLDQSTGSLGEVLRANQEAFSRLGERMNRVLDQMETTTRALNGVIGKVDQALVAEDIRQAGKRINQVLETLEKRLSTGELGALIRHGDDLLDQANRTFRRLDTGFMGLEANLRSIHEGLSDTMDHLNRLSRDLLEDPSRIWRKPGLEPYRGER